jgi:uncharacterized membrane protein
MMAELRHGPIEYTLVAYPGERPDPAVVQAITDLIEEGAVRLIDAVIIARGEDGTVEVTEVEDLSDEFGFGTVELEASGITPGEDLAYFAESVEPGTSAALLVVELLWARKLASALDASGGAVIASERIPAALVDETFDLAESASAE